MHFVEFICFLSVDLCILILPNYKNLLTMKKDVYSTVIGICIIIAFVIVANDIISSNSNYQKSVDIQTTTEQPEIVSTDLDLED